MPPPNVIDMLDADASYIGLDALSRQTFTPFDSVVLRTGSYSIHLILDVREDRRNNSDRLLDGLTGLGVRAERRHLALGDVLWVAKRLQPQGNEYDEVALDFIAERKRLDDLVSSLTSRKSRYHDQKVCMKLLASKIN